MSTLCFVLAGAQQAWGSSSRFTTRGTDRMPTKSGVIGLLASAMGLTRQTPLDAFHDLRFGVRIDQPGRVERDFQTASPTDGRRAMPLSYRYYLADSVFTTAIEAPDRTRLHEFAAALQNPKRPLYLGRRAFPPAGPIATDIVDTPLEQALQEAPWAARPWWRRTAAREGTVRLHYALDADPGDVGIDVLRDVPVSFDPNRREYAWRTVRHGSVVIDLGAPPDAPADGAAGSGQEALAEPPEHDPMTLLGKDS